MCRIAESVDRIMLDSLLKEEEVIGGSPKDAVMVQGITATFGFHQGRLLSHKPELAALANKMPLSFHKEGGGGASFLNLCEDRDGELWGQHRDMQDLVVLCIGVGIAEYCASRELWGLLPGGMPYIGFDTGVSFELSLFDEVEVPGVGKETGDER